MKTRSLSSDVDPSGVQSGSPMFRSSESYERELKQCANTESRLRKTIAGDALLMRRKDALIEQLENLNKESDHRMLNSLQLIVSLISLQSRSSANPETVSQLAVAANRVAMIVRVHQRLHCSDAEKHVAFKKFLEGLSQDFSGMLYTDDNAHTQIAVDGVEAMLPAATAIPLGYIVNELITNAAKYGTGSIAIRLDLDARKGYALSVTNDGPSLPDDFDPKRCTGLGMKIIRSFVQKIGGELQIGRADNDRGTRFTVLFA